ncbi:PREDICTED: muscle M-line assembly protein unc-89-like isoform X1 [Lupinus angustifolius]|uniref:muscle M-line assembly protein unc-89-like isoform X1 n=1 Tax=Lupinus angustifolius TaxID=3871 RepID=UPI00092FB861|nr:PREDICTED: muscle M-line assembly protein unc-89-like isoform X1 [Lupinus angustifolius]
MAEESVELPVISEETMSSSVEVRGHSAGKGSSENSNKKVVSRYLKPSTGSCHDICKYGREQAIGTKNRRSIPDRATRKKLYQSSKGGHGEIMISVSGLGASVDSKPANMSLAKLEKPVDSELQISDTSYSKKQESPIKSSDNKKQTRNEGLVKKKKTSLVKVKPSLLESGISSLARQETSSTAKEVKSSTESASKKVESPSKSTSRKVKTPSKSTSTKVETLPKSTSEEVETPSKSTSEEVETPSKSSSEEVETPSKSTSEEVETPSKSTSEEVETPSKSNSKKVKRPSESTSKKMGTGTPLKSTSNIKSSSKSTPRVETSSKSTAKMVKSPSKSSTLKDNGTELSPKSVTSLKPISVPGKITSLNSSESFGGQRNRDIKMEKVAVPSKAASRKSMKPLMAPLSPKVSPKRVQSINSKKLKSLKVVSQLKNQQIANARKVVPEELNDEEVEEKTLYVIEMESVNKTLQSDHNASYNDEPSLPQISTPNFASSSKFQPVSQEGQEESEYTTTKHEEDSVSRNHEEYMENGKTLEVVVKGKPKPRKGGIVYSEDKDDQMLKLKFRKGRMIENKVENNSPRKLKFRKTKVYQKAQPKADSQRKTFKRRDEACADNTGATPGPEHVVLRHQDKKDKKGSQGLFNNVIEETASKLAETRKSKVKALVGAFETVISLQDEKPSSNTAT